MKWRCQYLLVLFIYPKVLNLKPCPRPLSTLPYRILRGFGTQRYCGKSISVGVEFAEASSHSGSFSLPLTDARTVRSCVRSKLALSFFRILFTAKLSKVSESYNSSIVGKAHSGDQSVEDPSS